MRLLVSRLIAVALIAVTISACNLKALPGTQAKLAFGARTTLFDAPFPSEELRDPGQNLGLDLFPNPNNVDLITKALTLLHAGQNAFSPLERNLHRLRRTDRHSEPARRARLARARRESASALRRSEEPRLPENHARASRVHRHGKPLRRGQSLDHFALPRLPDSRAHCLCRGRSSLIKRCVRTALGRARQSAQDLIDPAARSPALGAGFWRLSRGRRRARAAWGLPERSRCVGRFHDGRSDLRSDQRPR